MFTDRKILNIISVSTFAILLATFFIPSNSGRIIAAVLLLPFAAITYIYIKKRLTLSIFSRQVLMIMSVIGALYVLLHYITGLHFGFVNTGYGLKPNIILRFILPIASIIFTTEVIRYVLRAQKRLSADIFAYLICIVADVLICSNISGITSFNRFMDVIGLTLFPAIIYNLLYNYLSVRYGMFPNLVYRGFTTLLFYFIPYSSAIPDSLVAFVNLIIPIIIYVFIDSLFEKKQKKAHGSAKKVSKIASIAIIAIALVIMTGTTMLISNQFKYGTLVIATESMTGELNKGDAAIYERYDGQIINVDQIIAFEKDGSVIVHRVVDIEILNGEYRFYTQGDANDDLDEGFVLKEDIIGLVKMKVAYIGYPTVWVRSLFSR